MNLENFLEKKPLYFAEIDYTRMPCVYEKIKTHFTQTTIIHVIGTNGKGTTGRFLSAALHNLGYKTAHYTSPHISDFNERIWLNGKNASNELLESTYEKLQNLLSKEDSDSLSYFEYTTFLAMLVFNTCEFIVLEAGLGGEHDATAVFPKSLTLVTPIGYDHENFLGSDIRSISLEKLNAIQNNAILSIQEHDEVYQVSQELAKEKSLSVRKITECINNRDEKILEEISQDLSLVDYLKDNLKLAIGALNFFNITYEVKSFNNAKLFGRLSYFSENIILDVGHNPLAASSILRALDGDKYTLVYNTYEDKQYKKILEILKPIIKNVEILPINEKRVVAREALQKVLIDLEIEYKDFSVIEENKKYLVFGSFLVVETFLRVVSE